MKFADDVEQYPAGDNDLDFLGRYKPKEYDPSEYTMMTHDPNVTRQAKIHNDDLLFETNSHRKQMEQLALEQSNSSVAHSRMSHKLRMLNENQSYMYGNSQLLTQEQVVA